jgi:hypothetical protein
MDKESLYKVSLMLGLGFVAFWILKPKSTSTSSSSSSSTKAYSGHDVKITDKDRENADIVMTAYALALQNNENAETLSELNNQTMKEFGLRTYKTKEGDYVVANKVGEKVLTAAI